MIVAAVMVVPTGCGNHCQKALFADAVQLAAHEIDALLRVALGVVLFA
jgi:hypothetical protein